MSPLRCLSALAIVVIAAGARISMAQTVHVPADFPTIQAALNSGATTVLVADGTYHEVLVVSTTVSLLPDPPADPRLPLPFPRVDGLTFNSNSNTIYVRGFHFTGLVSHGTTIGNEGITTLEACRLDGGFQSFGGSPLVRTIRLRNCLVFGDAYVYAYYNDVTGNTVFGGTLTVHSNGGNGALARDNVVYGPAPVGLSIPSGDSRGAATGNLVRGAQNGVVVSYATVSDNIVEDCSGHGYSMSANPAGSSTFANNTARRCGGHGFDASDLGLFPPLVTMTGNVADTCGLSGIHIGSGASAMSLQGNVVRSSGTHGIWVEGNGSPVGNTVLRAGGDGIRALSRCESNVVGRSVGAGIVAPEARHNTAYLNGGSGLVMNGAAPDTIRHNISYGNSNFGLVWSGVGTPVRSCNDWFGNLSGATSGVTPGASDLAVNPMFCNLPADVVTLAGTSQLLAAPGCGLIGALGMGCATAVDVAMPAPDDEHAFVARPTPARGVVELAWTRLDESGVIEVFDIQGSRRFHAPALAGAASFRWDGTDDQGRRLPDGVYFARRVTPTSQRTVRVILSR